MAINLEDKQGFENSKKSYKNLQTLIQVLLMKK